MCQAVEQPVETTQRDKQANANRMRGRDFIVIPPARMESRREDAVWRRGFLAVGGPPMQEDSRFLFAQLIES